MKQKLYALDAFFIEKLKLSENDPIVISLKHGRFGDSCIIEHFSVLC